jgi:hypothetical protein
MAQRVRCDLCDDAIPEDGHYIVRIDVFADPSLPAVTSEELAEADYDASMKKLLKQMDGMSADELQDQVHRRFEYRVCGACQKQVLANPLGRPRERRSHSN